MALQLYSAGTCCPSSKQPPHLSESLSSLGLAVLLVGLLGRHPAAFGGSSPAAAGLKLRGSFVLGLVKV